jgi:tellurite resistance protein TerC
MAIDNIFIILMVFSSMKIDEKYQHRILFFGIIGVILMRFIVISIGVNLIEKFSWILHILNLFLIILGAKMLIQKNENQKSILKNKFFVFIKKIIPHKDEINGPKFFISEFDQKTQKNKIYATPIFFSLLFIEIIDLIFAIDSLPAIFAITKNKYVIYTSNIFAILGLRALYFSLSGFYEKFTYLKYALGALLIFIGGKSFIADFFGIQKIPAEISLVVTFLILSFGILFSLKKSKNDLNKINQKQA